MALGTLGSGDVQIDDAAVNRVAGPPAIGAARTPGANAFPGIAPRVDHVHGLPAADVPVSQNYGDVAAQGAAPTFALSDHRHGMPASGAPSFAVPAIALGTAAAAGAAATIIRSDGTIAAFDATAPVTQAFGDAAAVGTIAFAARRDHKHGMPANPTPAFATPAIVLGSAAAAGAAGTVIRSDGTIAAFDATAPTTSAVGDAAAVGTAAFAARRDHVHGRESFATPAIVLGTAAAAGAAATPIRSDSTIVAFDATVPVTQAFSDAAATGAAAVAARRDHKHGMPANPTPAFATPAIVLGSAAAAGAAGTVIRSDGTIAAFDTTAPTTSAVGDAAAVGTIAFAARRDHVHGREAFATPAIVLGSAAAAGAATTPIRSDGTIAAFDATAPVTQAFSDVAAVGTAAFAARRDHKHGMPASPGGGVPGKASITANVAVTNTETQVVGYTVLANTLVAGSTYRVAFAGRGTVAASPGAIVWRIRFGPTTLTGNQPCSINATPLASTNVGFTVEALITVRTTGAGGTMIGDIVWVGGSGMYATTQASNVAGTAAIDTTVNNVLEATLITGEAGTTMTVHVAVIEQLI